ncbi:MAG: hypothetical protein NTW60_01450 [Candidatus Wolfebacteria bacterium]|nr:hypothetical protein [Candidatus Wolfebacteria bacterium]
MNKSTTLIILAVSLIISLAIGFGSGYLVGQKTTASNYQAQIEKAKKFFPLIPDVRSVSGVVKKISGNVVTIEMPASANPFEDLPTTREVAITDKTKIVKSEPKDTRAYQEEIAVYQEALKKVQRQTAPASTGTAPTTPAAMANMPVPPMPFSEKDVKLSDLKEGMQISVQAGENIKTATKFEAVKITISSIAAPAVAPSVAPAALPKP